jgi:hypothetical protein
MFVVPTSSRKFIILFPHRAGWIGQDSHASPHNPTHLAPRSVESLFEKDHVELINSPYEGNTRRSCLFFALLVACGCQQQAQSFQIVRSVATLPRSAPTTSLDFVPSDLSGVSLNGAEALVTAVQIFPFAVLAVGYCDNLKTMNENMQTLDRMHDTCVTLSEEIDDITKKWENITGMVIISVGLVVLIALRLPVLMHLR